MLTEAPTVKDRETVYRLVISQLFYDGHQTLAVSLSNLVKTHPPCPPSDRLLHIVTLGLRAEQADKDDYQCLKPDNLNPNVGIELDYETEARTMTPEPGLYETCYVTSHKAPCRADVDRMLAKSAMPADLAGGQETNQQLNMEAHPVIRTLYDHGEEVTCLEFHPTEQILVSGTGTQHTTIRLYDTNTAQCFVSSNPKDQHTAPITMVRYSPMANLYASSSKDGNIKIWDGISNKCVPQAHDGNEVCSVYFSKNGKYVLSSGKDSLVKLWELSMSRCLIAYTGAGASGKQNHRSQGVFNHTEDFVLFSDEKTTSLCTWDARNAERQRLLSLGHNNAVRYLCHSPTSPAFLTCSDDYRARFWYRRVET
ncbi:CSTF1 [Cordylochernes scorpioides]|uniref:Cleavage stimulation factor 50 kDa subunit n=1 Tax=Cordylochernes scorpioides TaxID=51811 RepID=A0ABY6LGH6_9ARAC|nr:CSTF1 [Cordylochernes scorpioides]